MMEEYAEMIFYQVASTTEDVTEEWARPPEGYNEDQESSKEDSYKKLLLQKIEILASVIPELNQIVTIFEAKVKHKLDTEDWKAKYFDLMRAYIDLPIALKIIESSLIHLKDPHAKVRYATLQLIGQYCENLAPKLQDACPKLFAALYEGLTAKKVPRVMRHYYATFLNFFHEDMNFSNFGTMSLLTFISFVSNYALIGISCVREAAIALVGELSHIFGEIFLLTSSQPWM